jgi:hypothetical protein
MKTIITLASIALLSVSCNRDQTTATGDATDTTAETAAIAYPLEVCIVSGEPLGSMGEPVTIVHEGRQIKFCCAECLPAFNENPEKYLGQLPQ